MGAGGSVPTGLSEDIIQLFKDCEEQQTLVAERDYAFLVSQSKQMWKNHKKIISVVTQKSKNQLRRTVNLHKGPPGQFAVQLKDMLGGPYGEFVRSAASAKADVDAEVLRTALSNIGCDEKSLVVVMCTSSPEELASLKQKYNDAGAVDLDQRVFGKLEKNSAFQKFMQQVVMSARDGDKEVDSENVTTHASLIYSVCSDTSSNLDESLFTLLCKISRTQCSYVNTELVSRHNVTLDGLVKRKFKGICSKAIGLWCLPKDEAIAHVIHDVLHDDNEEYDSLAVIIPKYDKLHIRAIAAKYEVLFSENMVSRIESQVVGNYKLALANWVSSFTYDGDKEEEMAKLISDHKNSVTGALDNNETTDNLRSCLISERDAIIAYIADQASSNSEPNNRPEPVRLALPPITGPSVKASVKANNDMSEKVAAQIAKDEKESSNEEIATENLAEIPIVTAPIDVTTADVGADETLESPGITSPLLRAKSLKSLVPEAEKDSFEKVYNGTCDFLREAFTIFDKDKSGYLETSEFWNALRSLNIGYTEDEIAGMVQWTDWDCDGHISYEEVINELAESVITIIEGRGANVLDELATIRTRLKQENEELIRLESSGLTPTLIQYLKDSFEAYDVDNNGGLGRDEFWRVLSVVLCETVNGLKEVEIEELRAKWDRNDDGWITWKEALDQFIIILNEMISDKRDHWIGLVDKPTGNLFWYNLRDESSCWMSEEDQLAYRAGEKINKS